MRTFPLFQRLFSSVIAGLAAGSAMATPGAWNQETGKGIAIVSGYYYATDHYFDRNGDRQPQPGFDKIELNPYVEYGLNETWTIGGTAYLDELSQDRAGGGERSNLGLGNTALFARYQLYRDGRYAIALEPFVALPAVYRADREPRSGHGNADAGMFAAGGMGFDAFGLHHYGELRAGYRHRFGSLGDQVVFEGKLGLSPAPRWTILPEAQFVLPGNGINMSQRSVAGRNDYRLTRLQLSAVYDVDDRWSVQAGVFDHAEGENTGAGGGGMLSLWRRF